MQEPQPLGHHLGDEKINSGHVASGPGKAGDKSELNWVFAYTEYDRDRRGGSFGRERGHVARRGDDGHLSANEIGQQRRQPSYGPPASGPRPSRFGLRRCQFR